MKFLKALILVTIITFSSFINASAGSPCDIINLDVINKVFHLENVDIENPPSGSSYPTCRYSWIGDENETLIENSVTIVIVEQKATYQSYEESLKAYSGSFVKVGIGENAVWSDKRNQLTVYMNERLFHVNVDVSPNLDLNKEKAMELAHIIISSF